MPTSVALPTLADVVEQIGMGFAQVRFVLTGGGVWFADGSELLLISAVTSTVAAEWNLDPGQRGSMVTVVYLGVCAGNLVAGPIGDKNGRRQLILASYLGIFFFSILSSMATSFMMLVFIRFFVGLAFGLGQPPVNALAVEITPSAWRVVVNTMFQSMFPLGEVYSASLILMDDPTMNNLNWRRLLQLGALPALVFWIMAYLFLPQSPFFLAQNGKKEDAKTVLATMSRDNCLPTTTWEFQDVAGEEESVEEEPWHGIDVEQFNRIWHGPLKITTMIMSYATFNVNLIFYGSLYAFAQVLPTLKTGGEVHDTANASAGAELLVGALWEIPGYVIAMFASLWMPRKLVLKVNCGVAVLSMLLFVAGATGGHSAEASLMWHIGYYMFKCIISCLFVMDYIYIAEVYPTTVRTTGSSVNIAAGRVGATCSPLVYELLKYWTGSFVMFFYLLSGTTIINLILIDYLPIETFNQALMNNMEDLQKWSARNDYGATEKAKDDEEANRS